MDGDKNVLGDSSEDGATDEQHPQQSESLPEIVWWVVALVILGVIIVAALAWLGPAIGNVFHPPPINYL